MARKPMVTRTIITTKAVVLCLDLQSHEVFEKEVALPHTFKDADKVLKGAEKVLNSDTIKVVQLKESKECETLYGMLEQDFIDNAVVLDPETRKEFVSEDEQ